MISNMSLSVTSFLYLKNFIIPKRLYTKQAALYQASSVSLLHPGIFPVPKESYSNVELRFAIWKCGGGGLKFEKELIQSTTTVAKQIVYFNKDRYDRLSIQFLDIITNEWNRFTLEINTLQETIREFNQMATNIAQLISDFVNGHFRVMDMTDIDLAGIRIE